MAIEYELFLQGVHKIALKHPNFQSQRKFTGKRPHISFKENPADYKGLGDKKYGTGFETTYIKAFDQFFCVLDIDNYKDSEYDIISAIPDSILATHTATTQSGGLHLYLLSEKPLKLQQHNSVPLDLKAIREDSYSNGKYGGLIVADYSWKQKYEPWGVDYVKKFYRHNEAPLLEVDINNVVEKIYKNLGLESENIKPYKPYNDFRVHNTRKYGTKKLKHMYTLICRVFDLSLNSKHNTTYRLNCRLRTLDDSERRLLCGWLIEDYGDLMDDIDNFKHEFLKR